MCRQGTILRIGHRVEAPLRGHLALAVRRVRGPPELRRSSATKPILRELGNDCGRRACCLPRQVALDIVVRGIHVLTTVVPKTVVVHNDVFRSFSRAGMPPAIGLRLLCGAGRIEAAAISCHDVGPKLWPVRWCELSSSSFNLLMLSVHSLRLCAQGLPPLA